MPIGLAKNDADTACRQASAKYNPLRLPPLLDLPGLSSPSLYTQFGMASTVFARITSVLVVASDAPTSDAGLPMPTPPQQPRTARYRQAIRTEKKQHMPARTSTPTR